MARLSRRGEELPLIRISHVLLLILLAPRAAGLAAQEPEETSAASRRLQGFLAISPRLTRVRGETSALLGAAALVQVSPRWRAGGAGFALLEEVAFEQGAGSAALRMGYGGILVEWMSAESSQSDPPSPSGTDWGLRLLAGAGNAEVRMLTFDTRLRSDNFVLLEPAVALQRTLTSRLTAAGVAGFRFAFYVNDLEGVGERDVGGPVLGLELRLGPF